MSSLAETSETLGRGCMRLSNVDWLTYTRLLRIFAEHPRVRLTYDHGELEIMSPVLEHDFDDRILGQFVVILTDELDRMGIYATLKVPEVWRLDGDVLTCNVLDEHGAYQAAAVSRSFPRVTPADLLAFLQEARRCRDQQPVLRKCRAWVRDRIAGTPRPEESQGSGNGGTP